MSPVVAAFLASLAAGLATGLGALPLLVAPDLVRRWQDAALGFAAGIMLSASYLSLMVPGLVMAGTLFAGAFPAALLVGAGILLGGASVWLANARVPHRHFVTGPEGSSPEGLRRLWLFVLAITIHNFPEGAAVGVAFGAGAADALPLALGIGLQNVAEGAAVAVALAGEGYRRRDAILISTLTGAVEPVGGLAGASVVALTQALLPAALGFAAGAMIFVISHEIIPETHRHGHQLRSTVALMIGVVLMMLLDHGLG